MQTPDTESSFQDDETNCPRCNGTGQGVATHRNFAPMPCPVCRGAGVVKVRADVRGVAIKQLDDEDVWP